MTAEDRDPDPPEMPVAFDGEGRPVAVDLPAVYDEAEQPDYERDGFEAKLVEFLAWLVEGTSVKSAGRKALLLAHFCGRSGCKDDGQLANRLGITRARISQLRRELSRILPHLSGCNRRQNLTTPHR